MPQVDFHFGVPALVMPDVYLRNGEVLIRDGLVAMSEDCCCGNGQCEVRFDFNFMAIDGLAGLFDLLAARGYANRRYASNAGANLSAALATCCVQDQADVQAITVFGPNGETVVVSVPQCTAAFPP